MKQNKNTSVIRFLALVTALVVLVCIVSFPAFASVNYYEDQPIPNMDVRYMSPLNSYVMCGPDNNDYTVCVAASSGYDNVYCCLIYDGSHYHPYIISDNSSATARVGVHYGNGSAAKEYSGIFCSTERVYNGWYYSGTVSWSSTWQGIIDNASHNCSVFSTIQEAITALDSSLNPGPDPQQLSLSVPAGNALYIDVQGVSNLSITMSMTSEVAHPADWSSNQYYGYASSYPSSFSGNPSGSNAINWHGYGDKTILNRYKSFSWSLIPGGPSHDYFFIVNPYATIDEYDQSFNPTIYVTVSLANGYKYYQMTGGISSDGTIGQQTDGTTATGSYNSETESWETINDQSGLPWSPSEGGGNIISQNSINSWLQTISTQIGNFFAGAIGAVTTLVSSGSDFIHSLSGLYAWLPAPVYAVLTSALILVITIGVIKVFI